MSDNPLNQLGGSKHADFMESLIETKEAGASLTQALQNNQAEASQEKLVEETEDVSAMGISIKTQKLQARTPTKIEKAKETQESRLIRKEDADGFADQFSRREGNKEYHLDPLILSRLALEELGLGINENSNPYDIIEILKQRMSGKGEDVDPALLDKGLEFLLEVTRAQIATANPTIRERLILIYNRIEAAKDNHYEANAVAIAVAAKIIGAVDAVSQKNGDSITTTLNRYRDIVHNPPELQVLRKYYEEKGYKAMVNEFDALSTYIGTNLKRKELENPELMQLAKAARKMQGLIFVFRGAKDQSRRFIQGYLRANHLIETFIDSDALDKNISRDRDESEDSQEREEEEKEENKEKENKKKGK